MTSILGRMRYHKRNRLMVSWDLEVYNHMLYEMKKSCINKKKNNNTVVDGSEPTTTLENSMFPTYFFLTQKILQFHEAKIATTGI